MFNDAGDGSIFFSVTSILKSFPANGGLKSNVPVSPVIPTIIALPPGITDPIG